MTTDTPRTDAKAVAITGFYSCATVPADFARQLERELNEAKADVERLKSMIERAMGPCSWPEYEKFKEKDGVHDRFLEQKQKLASLIAAINTAITEFPSNQASIYLAGIMEKLFQK